MNLDAIEDEMQDDIVTLAERVVEMGNRVHH
jgi:hypothetical protein